MDEPFLIRGGIAVDDRGTVRFVNDFHFERVKRMYILENWRPYFVRAWHGHLKEEKWITVVSGAAVVCITPIFVLPTGDNFELGAKVQRFVLDEAEPSVLYVPALYANGSMALMEGTQIIHFSSMTLEEAVSDNHLRWPWDALPDVWKEDQR